MTGTVINSVVDGPKILHLDIETAPLESYHWGIWQQNISLIQIQVEWSILSFTWNWDHEDQFHYMDSFEEADRRDDRRLLTKLWGLLDEADVVVAQNGVKFDIKKIKARMVMAGMRPFSPVRISDTMLIAKAEFGFTSNKLEWMAGKFSTIPKRSHGKFPGFELWVQFLAGNKAARREMRLYNIDDVRSLKQVYHRIRPWDSKAVNLGNYYPDSKMRCRVCGSDEVQKRGISKTNTGEYHRISCNKCGAWSRTRYTINTIGKRRANLSA